jgi:hypothetical protein
MHTQTFTHTTTASGPGKQHRFVTYAGAQASGAEPVLGVAMTDFAAGECFALHMLGLVAVEAGGPVAQGGLVGSDAQGRGVAVAADHVSLAGRAVNPVTAAGQTLLVLIK